MTAPTVVPATSWRGQGAKRVQRLYEELDGTYWADSPVTGYVWTADGTLALDPTAPAPSRSAAAKRAYRAQLVEGHADALQAVMSGPHIAVHNRCGHWIGVAIYDPTLATQEVTIHLVERMDVAPRCELHRDATGSLTLTAPRRGFYALSVVGLDNQPRVMEHVHAAKK